VLPERGLVVRLRLDAGIGAGIAVERQHSFQVAIVGGVHRAIVAVRARRSLRWDGAGPAA